MLLSTIICIIPTKLRDKEDNLTSAYWVGIDTVGKRRIDSIRKEVFNNAKMFGTADLEEKSLQDEQGYINNLQNYFRNYWGLCIIRISFKLWVDSKYRFVSIDNYI